MKEFNKYCLLRDYQLCITFDLEDEKIHERTQEKITPTKLYGRNHQIMSPTVSYNLGNQHLV